MAVEAIKVPPSLALVLNRAGDKSGVDFDYLLQTAMRESSLNPTAKASTSSAVGLFQFLENTWLDVMKSDGPRLGYQKYADSIQSEGSGKFTVADSRLRSEILALREDPAIAADLAAAFTKRNGEILSSKFGRMPNAGELYIAHFLGAEGASRLFEAGLSNPDQIAADIFPRQAKANKAIFYSNGEPRTIREVYKSLVAKHAPDPTSQQAAFTAQQLAPIQMPQGPLVSAAQRDVSFKSLFTSEQVPNPQPIAETGSAGTGFFAQIYGKK